MAPVGFGSMGFSSDLDDLHMTMDSNMDLASAVFSTPSLFAEPNSQSESGQSIECTNVEVVETSVASVNSVNAHTLSATISMAGAASLSLALSQVCSKASLMPVVKLPGNVTLRALEVSSLTLPKKSPLVSKKNCHAAGAVLSATKVAQQQVAMPEPFMKAFKSATTNFTAFPDLLRVPSNNDYGVPNGGAGLRKAAIVWFRNDLRVHDNEVLGAANNEALSVLPVYCFDPRDYGKSSSGFDKTGPYRTKFLVECVADLRKSLRARGSDLVVRIGKPEEVLLQLAKAVGADALYAHQEVTHEEVQTENCAIAALKDEGVESKLFWGSTLYHIDDLPFKTLDEMPANYGGFKEKTSNVEVRPTAEAPEKLKAFPSRRNINVGNIPSLQELGVSPSAGLKGQTQEQGSSPKPVSSLGLHWRAWDSLQLSSGGTAMTGGEMEALKRLSHFVAEAKNQTWRGGKESMMGATFSCKISPWLAMGCLSPRRMYQDLQPSGVKAVASAEGGVEDKSNLNWLVFELLWRDFFRFITKKYGSTRKGATVAPVVAGATA